MFISQVDNERSKTKLLKYFTQRLHARFLSGIYEYTHCVALTMSTKRLNVSEFYVMKEGF